MSTFSSYLTRKDAVLRGVLALALGLVFVIWPGVSIGTAVVLFAIFCFVDAAVALTGLFSSGRSAGDRILKVLRTVVDVTAAVVAIAYPGPTAGVLTVIIGVYAIVVGALELSAAGGPLAKAARSSGMLRVAGALSIIAGALLVVWPGIGVVTLAVVFGVYLAAYGALLLASAAMAPKHETVPNPAG
jgi:uncharacterized membrane protein HdeD (DUF308 family)